MAVYRLPHVPFHLTVWDQKEMSLPAHITIPTSSKTQAVIAYEALI